MSNLDIYNAVRAVPEDAQKKITGGRLNGKTDINPMWRIKTLTEQFGPVGIGWYYEIKEKRLEPGGNGEIAAFVEINLFVKHKEEWSKPITGIGGSSFVSNEKNGTYVSDECFKMALTDAISVSCKALGVGADVYWEKDKTKYAPNTNATPAKPKPDFKPAWLDDSDKMNAMFAKLDESKEPPEKKIRGWYLISDELLKRILEQYQKHRENGATANNNGQ